MNNIRPKLGLISKTSYFNQVIEFEKGDSNCLTGISPSERLGSMMETGLYSDCSFLVEDEVIRAHKLILAAASPKMEQIFLGTDVEQTELVEVPQSKRIMQLILKHVYLQDMDIESIEEAQDVIEAASFFQMNDLVELCCAGIEPENIEDLWPALNLACLYNSRPLKEACMSLALQNSESLLNHEGFFQLSPEALSFLLSREVIKINSEQEIINAVMDWGQNRLENSEENTNLRFELEKNGILQQLRILALNESEFVNFLTGIGRDIFTEDELDNLEYNYYSEVCEKFACPIRTERMIEQRIPICGTDYLVINSDDDTFTVNVKVFENQLKVRPLIKMIIIPSQINPANILYENVSHRTHYNECILVEITVHEKIISRGLFCDRIKYGDDVFINLNTFNTSPIYVDKFKDEEIQFYEAKIKITFKKHGYYPLAVDMKLDQSATIVLNEPCRFIQEFILTAPKF